MAKLSTYRRIVSTDYDDQYKDLVDRLGTSINNSMDQLFDALNNKLNFKDNISATIASVTVTVNSSGVPTRTTQFKLNSTQTTVEGIFTINAYGANDSSILPTAGVFVSFSKNEGFVTIENVKGLQADIPYVLKIVCLG